MCECVERDSGCVFVQRVSSIEAAELVQCEQTVSARPAQSHTSSLRLCQSNRGLHYIIVIMHARCSCKHTGLKGNEFMSLLVSLRRECKIILS
jgi:hypothetical protein